MAGVLNFSVLDGWWVEACQEGVTGWAIGGDGDGASDGEHAEAFYRELEGTIMPLYHGDPGHWRPMMKQSIAHIGYYFNSARIDATTCAGGQSTIATPTRCQLNRLTPRRIANWYRHR